MEGESSVTELLRSLMNALDNMAGTRENLASLKRQMEETRSRIQKADKQYPTIGEMLDYALASLSGERFHQTMQLLMKVGAVPSVSDLQDMVSENTRTGLAGMSQLRDELHFMLD